MKSKKVKYEEAQERQSAYNKLTLEQKVARLDAKFGVGLGAKKERAKLQKKLDIQHEKQN